MHFLFYLEKSRDVGFSFDKILITLVLPHKSRNRFLATSNCGRLQAQRDDPFTLEEANLTFYKDLESKLNPRSDSINFKV